MEICNKCSFSFSCRRDLIQHFTLRHSISENIKCWNCKRIFDKINSFRKHECKVNTFFNSETDSIITSLLNEDTVKHNVLNSELDNGADGTENIHFRENTFENFEENCNTDEIEGFLFDLILSMTSKLNINRKNVISIIQYVFEFCKKCLDLFGRLFGETNVSKFQNYIKTVFSEISSEYKLIQLYQKKKLIVLPEKKFLSQRPDVTYAGGLTISKDVTYTYISIIDTFDLFLQREEMCHYLMKYTTTLKTNKIFMSNVVQGSLWEKKIENINADFIIPYIVFYDDFESGNALGSHAGIHKIGGFYTSFLNLPPQLSSKLENIFLILLCHSSDIKKYGFAEILKQLIIDIKILEEKGIKITIKGETFTIKFILTLISGDNLGLHSILGFNESFMSNYFCRFCIDSKEKLLRCTKISDFEPRTKDNYENDLLKCNPSITGIKNKCVISEIESFHVIDNKFVDLMHDILEGVGPLVVSFVLKKLIQTTSLNLNFLNEKIRYFTYGKASDSSVPTISSDFMTKNTLKMSASEFLTFVKILSLIVGPVINENNKYWNLFIHLREIVSIVTQFSITRDITYYLQTVIEEMLQMYVHLTNQTLIPKMHFLLHYPEIMRAIGPLRNVWCMRFEAHHKLLKEIAKVCFNRKNLTWSLAIRYQFKKVNDEYLYQKKKLIDSVELQFPKHSLKIVLNDLYDTIFIMCDIDMSCKEFKWIKLNNIMFRLKNVIFISSDGINFTFGFIRKIVCSRHEEVIFIFEKLYSDFFNRHYFSHECKYSGEFDFIRVDEQKISPYFEPITYTEINNFVYVSPLSML